jgi:uncharacterized protein YhaN
MRIKELHIDGFGQFRDWTLVLPEAPVVVIYGTNEAGKSTLLNYIRTILFGFPKTNRISHYPARSGANHGGFLKIEDGGGNVFQIERFSTQNKAAATVKTQTGIIHGEPQLSSLLGHASRNVFETVFAFSLDNLQVIREGPKNRDDLLKDEDISGHIYSAGLGATELVSALSEIKKNMESIWAPGGRERDANKVEKEIQEIQEKIASITATTDAYSDLQNSHQKTQLDTDQFKKKIEEAERKHGSLLSQEAAWEDWINLRTIEKEIEGLQGHSYLPKNALGQVNKLEIDLENEQKLLEECKVNLSKAQIDATKAMSGTSVLEDESEISELNHKKEFLLRAVHDSPSVRSEFLIHKLNLDTQLRELGKGWDAGRLSSDDVSSTPIIVEIQSFEEKLAEQEQKTRSLETYLVAASASLEESERNLQEYLDELNELGSPDLDSGKLNDKKSVLSKCLNALPLYEYKKNQSERAKVSQIQTKASKRGGLKKISAPRIYIAILACFAGLPILGAGLFWENVNSSLLFYVGIALFILGSVSMAILGVQQLIYRTQRSRDDHAVSSPDPEADFLETKTLVTELLTILGLDIDSRNLSDDLTELGIYYNRVQEKFDGLSNIESNLSRERQRLELRASAVNKISADCEAAKAKLSELESLWKEWLVTRNLPDNLGPRIMGDYIGQIKAAREMNTLVQSSQDRIGQMESAMEDYCVKVKALGDKYEENYNPEEILSLVQVSDRLTERIGKDKEENFRKISLEKEVEKCKVALESRVLRLEEVREQKGRLIKESKSESADDLRAKISESQHYQDSQNAIRESSKNIAKLSGPGEQLVSFQKELEKTNLNEIRTDIATTKSALDDLGIERDSLLKKGGELAQQIQSIAGEDQLSLLRLERNGLTEQLSDLARNWQRLKIAEILLQRAREKFQEERQPDVIKHAEGVFSDITKQRYPTLFAPPGDQAVFVREEAVDKYPEHLSRGTKEQLYLSLRIGLIREHGTRSEPLPVIVDEILVNFDPDRTSRACDALVNLSDTNQVLVFTCHPDMIEKFKKSHSGTKVLNLE